MPRPQPLDPVVPSRAGRPDSQTCRLHTLTPPAAVPQMLADAMRVPCQLLLGRYLSATDNIAVNVVLVGGREMVVDLVRRPGQLLLPDTPSPRDSVTETPTDAGAGFTTGAKVVIPTIPPPQERAIATQSLPVMPAAASTAVSPVVSQPCMGSAGALPERLPDASSAYRAASQAGTAAALAPPALAAPRAAASAGGAAPAAGASTRPVDAASAGPMPDLIRLDSGERLEKELEALHVGALQQQTQDQGHADAVARQQAHDPATGGRNVGHAGLGAVFVQQQHCSGSGAVGAGAAAGAAADHAAAGRAEGVCATAVAAHGVDSSAASDAAVGAANGAACTGAAATRPQDVVAAAARHWPIAARGAAAQRDGPAAAPVGKPLDVGPRQCAGRGRRAAVCRAVAVPAAAWHGDVGPGIGHGDAGSLGVDRGAAAAHQRFLGGTAGDTASGAAVALVVHDVDDV
eukprot:363712-Chlamydomonas_euryale.AAC.20